MTRSGMLSSHIGVLSATGGTHTRKVRRIESREITSRGTWPVCSARIAKTSSATGVSSSRRTRSTGLVRTTPPYRSHLLIGSLDTCTASSACRSRDEWYHFRPRRWVTTPSRSGHRGRLGTAGPARRELAFHRLAALARPAVRRRPVRRERLDDGRGALDLGVRHPDLDPALQRRDFSDERGARLTADLRVKPFALEGVPDEVRDGRVRVAVDASHGRGGECLP